MKHVLRDLLMVAILLSSTQSAGVVHWPCWVDNSKPGVLCTSNQVVRDAKGNRI